MSRLARVVVPGIPHHRRSDIFLRTLRDDGRSVGSKSSAELSGLSFNCNTGHNSLYYVFLQGRIRNLNASFRGLQHEKEVRFKIRFLAGRDWPTADRLGTQTGAGFSGARL